MKNLSITYNGNTKTEFHNFNELYNFLSYVYNNNDFILYFKQEKIYINNPFLFYENTTKELLSDIKRIINESLIFNNNSFYFEIETDEPLIIQESFNIIIRFEITDLF